MHIILTAIFLISCDITCVEAFLHRSPTVLAPIESHKTRTFNIDAMAIKNGNAKCLMSHFRNKQNLLIRTYAAKIPNPKATFVLVHGNCCHFRAEFCAYNLKWYMDAHGIGTPEVDDIVQNELKAVYQSNAALGKAAPDATFPDAFLLDGKNFFDISPRFKYEGSFIEKLNALGFDVYGLDLQSNGLSEGVYGKRNYFLSLEDVVRDVVQFIDIVKRGKFENTEETYDETVIGGPSTVGRVYLAGISMGGNVVLRVAQTTSRYNKEQQKFINGVIAFAAMTDLSSYTTGIGKKIQLLISKTIAWFNPYCTMFLPEDKRVSNINAFVRANDPHYFVGTQCYAMIFNLFDATHVLRKNHKFYPMDLPTLLLHAKKDDVCDIAGSRALVKKHLKRHKDLVLEELEGNVHCITSSMFVDEIMPHVKTWIKRVVG